MRVLIEVVHIAIGLIAATAIGWAAAWSYPRATQDIWLVTFVAMALVVLMGGPADFAIHDSVGREVLYELGCNSFQSVF